jgi:hypothetical protein
VDLEVRINSALKGSTHLIGSAVRQSLSKDMRCLAFSTISLVLKVINGHNLTIQLHKKTVVFSPLQEIIQIFCS